jgi:hypothetical protein
VVLQLISAMVEASNSHATSIARTACYAHSLRTRRRASPLPTPPSCGVF